MWLRRHRAFLGWQALFTATAGNSDQAKAQAAQARRVGRGVEAQTLALLAEAIIALADGRDAEAAAHVGSVIETGVCDPLVIAIRAGPHLGAFIAAQPQWRTWLQRLLAASRDASLADSLGLRIPRAAKTKTNLSPRETEVHELNGQPALVFYHENAPFAALLLAIANGRIHRVFFHADIERLRYLGPRANQR